MAGNLVQAAVTNTAYWWQSSAASLHWRYQSTPKYCRLFPPAHEATGRPDTLICSPSVNLEDLQSLQTQPLTSVNLVLDSWQKLRRDQGQVIDEGVWFAVDPHSPKQRTEGMNLVRVSAMEALSRWSPQVMERPPIERAIASSQAFCLFDPKHPETGAIACKHGDVTGIHDLYGEEEVQQLLLAVVSQQLADQRLVGRCSKRMLTLLKPFGFYAIGAWQTWRPLL